MGRKRQVPISQRDGSAAAALRQRRVIGKSSKATQNTISTFHTLLKRQAQLKRALSKDGSSSQAAVLQAQLAEVDSAITDLGGLDSYQKASTLGQSTQRGGDSSVVLIEWLKELGEAKLREGLPGQKRKMRMLEIGALSPENAAAKRPYILNTPIDLNSQHPDILAQDFLQRPLPKTDADRFDIVSCSLVLNFVPEPRDRGRMLRLIHKQLLPSERSYLFLVLPTACTENSRYMTADHLRALLRHIGFEEVRKRAKPGGKVIYTLWKWQKGDDIAAFGNGHSFQKRVELRAGGKRNNFVVLLD